MILATAILIIAAGLMGWQKYRATYEKVESELLGAAELLNEQLAAGTSPQSLSVSEAIFHRFGKADRDHAYWILWKEDGTVLATHGMIPAIVSQPPHLPSRSAKRPYILQAHGRHLHLSIQTATGYRLLIGRPLAKEFDDFGRMIGWMCIALLIGLSMAALASWRLASLVTGPIKDLANSASTIRHQALDRRLQVPQPSQEMTSCANSLNGMLDDLELAFSKQRRFTADAAHELRTPVAIISSQCALSLSKPRECEDYVAALATCQRSAGHMSRLINQLLVLSRLDVGADVVFDEPVRLDQVCQQAVAMMQPEAAQRGIRLRAQLIPAVILGNETQWMQVLINLISNAIRFSNEATEVLISLEIVDASVLLRVADQGIGISQEHMPMVFDRFYQIDQARTTDESSGAGLGLSIVSEIVRRHGGSLRMESTLGHGTTVTVELPLVQSQS